MFRLIAFLLVVLSTQAFSEESNPRGSESKADTTQGDNQRGGAPKQITVPANSASPTIINVTAGKQTGEESNCSHPKNWTEWGSFSVCRSFEWFDSEKTIAIFTVILGIATGFLWWATRALVRGAEDTARRQLRAYISINPVEINSTADSEERFTQVTCFLKNHGQTPAREMHYIFDFDVLPNPLVSGFVFPPPTIPIHANSTLFPQADMRVWFNFNRLLTTEEFNLVEQDRLRLHIWGSVFYKTAFAQQCQTDFRASVGGPAFVANLRAVRRNTKGPSFNWTWEPGHGEGD